MALLVVAVLIQTTLAPYMKVSGVHPDLVLLLVIGWTILSGIEDGLFWALIGGLSLDLMSAAPFGLFSLALLIVSIVTSAIQGRVFGSSILLPLSLTFPLSLLFNGIVLVLLNLVRQPVSWIDAFYTVLLPAALLDTGVMLLVFPPLVYLSRRLNPRQSVSL